MKFDFIIGNPPYQDEVLGDNKGYAPPVYHKFLEESYKIAEKVEMIHPARFLFNAGATPKQWNEKMLNDEHLTVLDYNSNSQDIFPNTDIKGGIAITLRDEKKKYGKIDVFVCNKILRSIQHKVNADNYNNFSHLIFTPERYKFTKTMHTDHPEVESMLSKGHKFDLKSNVLNKLKDIIFFDEMPKDNHKYIRIWGVVNLKRCAKWIRSDYIVGPSNFDCYKVFLPKANGSGKFGETLGAPQLANPFEGHTQTFMSIGEFNDFYEVENISKYLKTKFLRTLLDILKVTQNTPTSVWRLIPIQDFTKNSDINWSVSISNIDKQLYKKYALSEEEIKFIETNVREME